MEFELAKLRAAGQRGESTQAMMPSTPDQTPLPIANTGAVDARVVDAWCEWLGALAKDAEAALAAAIAYQQLDDPSRDRWLSALESDAGRIEVPRIAVYAPLLAVESDPERRERIISAIGPVDSSVTPRRPARGLRGVSRDGSIVASIVAPLYLDFVQVLACGYRPGEGFAWVRHDPIVDYRKAPDAGEQIAEVTVEAIPMKPLVDELAHAILAHTRSGRPLPEALKIFADLFGPDSSKPES